MRPVFFAFVLCFAALPLAADEGAPPKDAPLFEGLDELADGMRKLLEGIQNDVAPLMDDLSEQLQGLNAYHPPQVLPNGDIIIRRKTPSEQTDKKDGDSDGAIDI